MAENIMENLEELQVYLRNSIQEILICKHKETEELYLVNTVFDNNTLEALDLRQLKKDVPSIEEISNTEDGIKIYTKYFFHPSLMDTVGEDKEMPLEKQMSYTGYILDKLLKLRHLPLSVLEALFNSNHLIVDDKGRLQILGSIIINPDHEKLDLQDIFKRIGNILHLIFSGEEIEGGDIDKSIPPDIKKIITNCYNNHYFNFEELVSDFKGSSVYKLMNPESEEGHRVHLMRKNLKSKKRFYHFKKNGAKIAIIIIVLLPLIAFAGGKLVDFAKDKIGNDSNIPVVDQNNDDEDDPNENNETVNNDNNNDNDSQNTDDKDDSDKIDVDDEMTKYYNDVIEQSGNDRIGVLDDSTYYRGNQSVMVDNEKESGDNFLVGVVDLNDGEFSFMKDRKNIDVSMWIRSNVSLDAMITLKLINNDNKIISQITKNVHIPSMMWTLHSLDISTLHGDFIKIYVTPKAAGKMWIDSVEVEILK
ncbi:hypothetical protein [Sporosalibacterium faouarense]|uniref:hypothetical protein n=1 Tax=Sporosalibacterium faouarense TaxID=516123 RepID=UPI00141D348B|nr:hypothetical protein [Sporosalibacterium faouarense]MTI48461.1 hypothetical protein [Bacillota bacterium]